MNNHRIIILLLAAAFFIITGCTPKTTSDKIDALKQQVEADAKTLQRIEDKEFALLQSDFRHCDSMLQYLNETQLDASFDKLNLTQAYLQQFKDVKPLMVSKMDYLIVQLDNLKSDAESHYLSDSLVLVYLDTETKVADTLHKQVDYFQDRFLKCQHSLDSLKNSWK